MKKLSPKYWAIYDSFVNDILPFTMFKYRQDVYDKMISDFGEDWETKFPRFSIKLIEINIISENSENSDNIDNEK